jgi:hypothetical protein
MDGNLLADYAAVSIAIVGILVAWYFGRRAEFALANWLQELRSWASEAIHVLAEARAATTSEFGTRSDREFQCVHRLSALVDRGRFYLPNEPRDRDDSHKPLAYRGNRHAALDPLVGAIRVLDGTARVDNRQEYLVELQREFVSEIYRILRPDHQNRTIAKMIRSSYKSRAEDKFVGGLLPGGTVPQGATALLTQIGKRIAGQKKQLLPGELQNPPK